MKKKTQYIGAALALAMTGLSEATFILVDDFSTYPLGPVSGGTGGWQVTGDANFASDPDDAGNTVLSSAETAGVTTADSYKPMPVISTSGTGTLFFRARAAATADLVIGSSDVAAPASWDNFEGYMRFAGGNIDVRNGGGFANVGTYTADEWYNVWLVLDHTTDTTTVYFSQGSDDAGVAAGSGGFRTSGGNTEKEDLINVFIRSNDPNSIGYVDDIYVDNTGINLSNPSVIPEPSAALLSFAGLVFGWRRNRK